MTLMKIKQPSSKGIVLSTLLIISIITISSLMDTNAQSSQIDEKSVAFEKTSLIEFVNKSNKEIAEVRLWLDNDVEFKSFKSEDGWTGIKNSAGVLVFSSATGVESSEIVKFGIKTDKEKPSISWKVLDEQNNQLGIGKSIPTELKSTVVDTPDPARDDPPKDDNIKDTGVLETSTLRIIPDKPRVGDTIRVIGTSYGQDEILNFYIDGKRIIAFETDSDGNFVTTTKIPESQKADRADFEVRDSAGNKKSISLRIDKAESRMDPVETVPLTLNGLPSVLHRGDNIKITGTANPGSTVTAQILGPENNIVTAEPRPVDNEGKWDFETLIPQDTPYGKYEAIVTDGIETKEISWRVESSKIIEMHPITLKFDPGDVLKFNGTAIANESIEFILENPLGVEIFSDVKQVNESGYVEFEFQTELSSTEGTYVLFAKQRDSTEIILTGLGELPKEHLIANLDKLNYKASETATINIDGPSSAKISLIVIDPSDKERFSDNNIVLQPDGKINYKLDLKDYTSGEYTLVLSRANTKTTEKFSVGLQFGSGKIEIGTTKTDYETNDPILVLGKTNANVLVTLELIDPKGNVIKEKETFTNKDGRISEGSFRIPSDAIAGTWIMKATSGPNFATTELKVVATLQEGMIVIFEEIIDTPVTDDLVKIKVLGGQATVEITVTNEAGDIIGEKVSFPASSSGEISTQWPIPEDTPPGTYTITAEDAFNTATTTFVLE